MNYIKPFGKFNEGITIKTWEGMNKTQRLTFLIKQFKLSVKEANEIYKSDIKDLPEKIKNYFEENN